ncbi:MAG: hypothetical protein WBW72_04425, partial [Erwinia billingiae]
MSQATLISFISGLLVVLFLAWLSKRGSLSKAKAVLLAFVLLFVGNLYYFGFVAPQQQQEARLAAAEQRLATLPVYRTIKDQQPALYQTLDQEF